MFEPRRSFTLVEPREDGHSMFESRRLFTLVEPREDGHSTFESRLSTLVDRREDGHSTFESRLSTLVDRRDIKMLDSERLPFKIYTQQSHRSFVFINPAQGPH